MARAGDYLYEPPGETHTLVVDGEEEMVTLFHVTGPLVYVDPDGNATGYDDVFTKIEMARRHYAAVGLPPETLDALIR